MDSQTDQAPPPPVSAIATIAAMQPGDSHFFPADEVAPTSVKSLASRVKATDPPEKRRVFKTKRMGNGCRIWRVDEPATTGA